MRWYVPREEWAEAFFGGGEGREEARTWACSSVELIDFVFETRFKAEAGLAQAETLSKRFRARPNQVTPLRQHQGLELGAGICESRF
ncbi:hypothetical protein FPOAC1_004624 [Fusarium poae]|uniref:hypothetical protein n=1 Tax=Fusarium poae TaxID=36050 RepID=UPI001CEB7D30|nr:hypothetical protein FPOAC1_004624 [Fusarium poae]KAG8671377.1 hypothetical protein FPOAC1_004624 [Fusarium poae]